MNQTGVSCGPPLGRLTARIALRRLGADRKPLICSDGAEGVIACSTFCSGGTVRSTDVPSEKIAPAREPALVDSCPATTRAFACGTSGDVQGPFSAGAC